jgi:hypothetical protein
MNSPVAGAWQLISDSHDGLFVLTDNYYSVVTAEKNRTKFKADKPTDAEEAEAYRSFMTATGSYELSGTTILCHRVASRNPNSTGVDASFEWSVDGDQLTMKSGTDAPDWVWKRLE